MTENTTASAELVAVDPASGEVINLKDATTTDLVATVERALELDGRLREFRQAIIDEVAGRMDQHNKRKVQVGDELELETNAPSTETYPVEPTREALKRLVAAEVLAVEVLDQVITYPRPAPPAPRVSMRELNKLKAHDNPEVARALGAVRVKSPQRRTLKINRKDG